MKNAYLHESKINRSEGRLFITTSPKRTTTVLASELFWLNDKSSREEALIKIKWHCERHAYMLQEEETHV